jgi:hypothetical protein
MSFEDTAAVPTRMSTGTSILPSEDAATRAALRQAIPVVREPPNIAIFFVSAKYELKKILDTAAQVFEKTTILGCTTAGELTERGITRNSVSVALITSDNFTYKANIANNVSRDAPAAAQTLVGELPTLAKEAAKHARRGSATLLLTDTMTAPAERLVAAMRKLTKPHHWIFGGAAGDDGALKATYVGIPGKVSADSAVSLNVFAADPWGIGVEHGMRAATSKRIVTRATGSVIHELDGKPAFQMFEELISERGLVVPQERMLEFFFKNELGVYFFDDICKVRAIYGLETGGGLRTTGDIPVGSSVCVMTGEADSLIDATRRAADEARQGLKGKRAAGVFVFSCMCRMLILGSSAKRELDAVREVFPQVPIAGFYTYGEIARFGGRNDGFHNTTAVVVAIPE